MTLGTSHDAEVLHRYESRVPRCGNERTKYVRFGGNAWQTRTALCIDGHRAEVGVPRVLVSAEE